MQELEKVRMLFDKTKVLVITQTQLNELLEQIDDLYKKKEHNVITNYITPDDARRAMEQERTKAFDEVDSLIKRFESSVKPEDQEIVGHIRYDFNSLRDEAKHLVPR